MTTTYGSIFEQIKASAKTNPVLRSESDESLQKTADKIAAKVEKFQSDQVVAGDWVKIGDEYYRVGIANPDSVQFTNSWQAYLCDGYCDFSGSFDYPVKISDLGLNLTEEKKDGWCWIFHGYSGASRGVYFRSPMRVWGCGSIDSIQSVLHLISKGVK